jgi:hypothetical protein
MNNSNIKNNDDDAKVFKISLGYYVSLPPYKAHLSKSKANSTHIPKPPEKVNPPFPGKAPEDTDYRFCPSVRSCR